MLKRLLTFATDRIYNLPVLVLMPHSRCNCRCVMCDIWKANNEKRELSVEDLERHVEDFRKFGLREVAFSGGEALMHANLWKFCQVLKSIHVKITLLSTGLLLEKNAQAVTENVDEVIISLDGSETIHDRIRNIPNGFKKLSEGVASLKKLDPQFAVSARCVLQRYNYFDFMNIVSAARAIGFDRISFLGADVSTDAFNRVGGWSEKRVAEVALTNDEAADFEGIIESSFHSLKDEYESRFIAESPVKMRKIVQYYKALNGNAVFPGTVCNAPWVSAVIESDGSVMPCFFHKPYGNIYEDSFADIINSDNAVTFRKNLDVKHDPVCQKCVCSLKIGLRQFN